jgi:hypothetical protein
VRGVHCPSADPGTPDLERAIKSAASQHRDADTGDHRNTRTPDNEPGPVGSKHHADPIRERAPMVAASTSGLVEADTAAPGCANSAGTITAEDFPDRGGPSTSTARSLPANRHAPVASSPR